MHIGYASLVKHRVEQNKTFQSYKYINDNVGAEELEIDNMVHVSQTYLTIGSFCLGKLEQFQITQGISLNSSTWPMKLVS